MALAPYQLKQPASHFYRPSLSGPEMESLLATKSDLELLIQRSQDYLKSPYADYRERVRIEAWIEDLNRQLDDIERQLSEQSQQ